MVRATDSNSPGWRQRIGRIASIGASVAVFGGLAWGLTFGVPVLEERLMLRAHAVPVRVVFDWPPLGGLSTPATPGSVEPATWLPLAVRDELMATAHAAIERTADPLSPDGLRLVAQTLADTGWFEAITAVRRDRSKDGARVLRIEAQWRRPAAVVRLGELDYLVSWSGQIMPVAYPRGTSGQVAIVGASQQPTRVDGRVAHGQVWPGRDISAALEVLSVVRPQRWIDQVEAIDVSAYASSRQLALLTTWGNRVVWGGAPSDHVPGEVSAAVKLARLEALARRFGGRIDAGHRVLEIAGPVTTVDNSATAEASALPTSGR